MLGGLVGDVAGAHAAPLGLVATHFGGSLAVGGGEDGEALAGVAEALLADVGAPCDGVAVVDGVVEDFHHLINGHVVAQAPTPVVLYFEDELLVEGVMGVRGDADVVVGVEAKALAEALGGVLHAFVVELLGDLAKVNLVDGLDGFEPEGFAVGAVLQFLQLAFGHGLDHAVGEGAELCVVGEGVAVSGAGGHFGVGDHAVVFEAVDDVVEGAALAEGDVAVCADGGHGAVVVGLLDDVHLAEVVLAFAHAEQLGLEECETAVAPAGTGVVLVLDGGDGDDLDGVKLVALVLFFLFLCEHSAGADGDGAKGKECFLHVYVFVC